MPHAIHTHYLEVVSRPGKFQGEPPYVPYLYKEARDYGIENEGDGTLLMDVSDQDRELFPELEGIQQVRLFEDEVGFIRQHSVVRINELAAAPVPDTLVCTTAELADALARSPGVATACAPLLADFLATKVPGFSRQHFLHRAGA